MPERGITLNDIVCVATQCIFTGVVAAASLIPISKGVISSEPVLIAAAVVPTVVIMSGNGVIEWWFSSRRNKSSPK